MYLNNIPGPTDQLNNSQPQIQNNFLEIYNWVAINHEQFDTANSGKHTQVTLPVNVAPTPTGLTEANIYTRTSANTNNLELTWQRPLNQPVVGPGAIIEMTAQNNFGNPNFGWTRLPSGILLKWGQAGSTGTGFVVTYPLNINGIVAPPFTVNPFSIQLTCFTNGNTVGGATITLNGVLGFTMNSFNTSTLAPNSGTFFYLSIGV